MRARPPHPVTTRAIRRRGDRRAAIAPPAGCYDESMTSQSDDVDALLDRASVLYQAVLGRPIDDGARAALAAKAGAQRDPAFFLTVQLTQSSEFTSRLVQRAQDAHLHLIHHARDIMVRRLLPPARSI